MSDMSKIEAAIESCINKFSHEMHLPPDIYKNILLSSLEPTKQDIVNLAKAIQENNWDQTQQISHRFKGTFSNLRVDELAGIAKEMNDLAKKSENMPRIAELFKQFEAFFVPFAQILEKK